MNHPDLVDWRLRHGSMCDVCPLKGQRKVGADGPVLAQHIVILDMPSSDDEELGVAAGFKYGRPARSPSAYYWKLENLVPAGLATVTNVPGRNWPTVALKDTQILNVTMCHNPRDPRGKKPESAKARRCCANSLRAWLRRARGVNTDISIHPCGGPVLSTLVQSKMAIDSYRGRFMGNVHGVTLGPTELEWDRYLADEPENDILKMVLRGQKPTEVWWPQFEKTLKKILTWQRAGMRKAARLAAKEREKDGNN
jgi:hypothetical protein